MSHNIISSINGIDLYYTVTGDANARPIVFIHGFPFSSDMWKGQVQALREKRKNLRIISYDLRGHGRSGAGDGQYTIELFVDDLIALLEQLEIEKTILCGFSMGGYIALRAIERDPERFSAIILCDTMSAADSNEAKIRRANSVKQIKKEGAERFADDFLKVVFAPQTFVTFPHVVDEIRRIVLSNSPIGICGALLAMGGRTDTTELLSKISVPALIIVGENDNVTPQSAAKIMHDRIPNSKLCVIKNVAHMSNLENASDFNEHLAGFIDALK